MTTLTDRLANALVTFASDENGAITVDFVVMTSAITLLGISVVGAFSGETVRIANDTSEFIASQQTSP